jgi:hypothetical protein
VVRLEGVSVGTTEGFREFGGGVVDVVAERLGGEVKTPIKSAMIRKPMNRHYMQNTVVETIPDKPHEALSSNVLLGLQFVHDEGLESLRLTRGSQLPVSDFL